MQGKHQWTNATLAIRIAETLRDFELKIPKEKIENGLEIAEHKGRLEFWTNLDAPSILFDGAHNAAGAKALREYLDEFVKQPITLVFGAMRDKDLSEIAETLFPKASNLIFTKPDNPRSMPTEDLLKFIPKDFVKNNVFQTETVAQALEIAQKKSSNEDLICVTGSLYLVGEAQKYLTEVH
jgi:dihydrofolate synthase/folylpolyglutamate synthase